MRRSDDKVVVVGAGIIGICVAAYLKDAGFDVTVLDSAGICEGASAGNAGAFAFSDLLPLVHKGVLKKIPGWLLDPLGPLSIPPSHLPALLPWLLRFWRASATRHYQPAVAAQAALMRLAESEWMTYLDRAGLRTMLRENGSLELYQGERQFKASLKGWDMRACFQVPFRHLDRAELETMQPGLARSFTHATFVPGWKTVGDPQRLGKALWARSGARFLRARVRAVSARERGAELHLSGGEVMRCGTLVVAAGAWSHLLARDLGEAIPLEADRGYNTTIGSKGFDVRRQLIFSAHGFVITPLDTGLRIGGAVELGGLERAPNYARAGAMLALARTFLPGLDAGGARQWMGYRPLLPDSLPVIGAAHHAPGVYYAFGHGHLGLTQAAATARLIRDHILGHTPAIPLEPFSSARF